MISCFRRRWDAVPRGNEKGAVLLFVAVGMVGCLLAAGLALDVGLGYVTKAQLSRAVDAAALAGARSLRQGETRARDRAEAVAAANGLSGVGPSSLSITFGSNEWGEKTVSVSASRTQPTLLMKLIEQDSLTVQSGAVAAIPPVDMVLVLDQSASLGAVGAWDDLQQAARAFVRHFDDDIDQVGIVSFNVRAIDHFKIKQPFTDDAISTISSMHSLGYTNTGEGLRLAHGQFQEPTVRERSAKVVVFFTDGRPTAFRGNLGGQDRVIAALANLRPDGFWNNPDEIPMDPHYPDPTDCWSPSLLYCWDYSGTEVWAQGEADGLFWADKIREEHIYIYTIGLGDPTRPPWDPSSVNPEYLRALANEDRVSNPDQPEGRMYFAPGPDDLLRVFNLVAEDLLARLAH